jgi:hypothetical protein
VLLQPQVELRLLLSGGKKIDDMGLDPERHGAAA